MTLKETTPILTAGIIKSLMYIIYLNVGTWEERDSFHGPELESETVLTTLENFN